MSSVYEALTNLVRNLVGQLGVNRSVLTKAVATEVEAPPARSAIPERDCDVRPDPYSQQTGLFEKIRLLLDVGFEDWDAPFDYCPNV